MVRRMWGTLRRCRPLARAPSREISYQGELYSMSRRRVRDGDEAKRWGGSTTRPLQNSRRWNRFLVPGADDDDEVRCSKHHVTSTQSYAVRPN